MKKVNIHQMVFCALFAALIVVFAQIQVPLPGLVPISLATFGVMMAGLLLGWKFGLMAVAVYVLLGAVGVPVFGEKGAGILLGPNGTAGFGHFCVLFAGHYLVHACYGPDAWGEHGTVRAALPAWRRGEDGAGFFPDAAVAQGDKSLRLFLPPFLDELREW